LEAKVKTKIAIACQGGGAETAFTAGALQALFEAKIDEEFDIVSLGGTSGGAVCASLIWYALQSGEQPVWQRLLDFWTESNRPKSMQEQLFNRFYVVTIGRQGLHADSRSESLFVLLEVSVRNGYPYPSQYLQGFQSGLEGAHRFRTHTRMGPAQQKTRIDRWCRRRPERKIEEILFAQ
jgi:hypothetical protein